VDTVDWVEQLKVGGPMAVVLGAAVVALARAYAAKDLALTQAQQARIDDLKDIVKRSADE
jgi:hypothetical protein